MYVVANRWRDSYLYGHFAPPSLRFSSCLNPCEGFLGDQISAYLRNKGLTEGCPSMDVLYKFMDLSVVDCPEMLYTYNPVFNIEKEHPETQIETVGVVEATSTHRPLTRSQGMKGIFSLAVSGCPWLLFFFVRFDFYFFDFGYCELIENCFQIVVELKKSFSLPINNLLFIFMNQTLNIVHFYQFHFRFFIFFMFIGILWGFISNNETLKKGNWFP